MNRFAYFDHSDINDIIEPSSVVVFDLNGLIIDDEPIQLAATNQCLKKYDVVLTEDDWKDRCVGRKPMEYLKPIISEKISLEIADQDALNCLSDKESHYIALIADQSKKLVRPGFYDFLDYLLANKYPLAIATSTTKANAEFILGDECLDISRNFQFIVTGDQVNKSKPDPEIYNLVRSRFGGQSIYTVFEDSATGVWSASSAAMTCIAVPNRFTESHEMKGASMCIDSFLRTANIRQSL